MKQELLINQPLLKDSSIVHNSNNSAEQAKMNSAVSINVPKSSPNLVPIKYSKSLIPRSAHTTVSNESIVGNELEDTKEHRKGVITRLKRPPIYFPPRLKEPVEITTSAIQPNQQSLIESRDIKRPVTSLQNPMEWQDTLITPKE